MVYVAEILVWIFFIIIIIIIVWIIVARLQSNNTTGTGASDDSDQFSDAIIQESIEKIIRKDGWSTGDTSDNNDRNVCLLYTFPGRMDGIKAIQGWPSLNTGFLNSLTPTQLSSCIDPDQLNAQQMVRTCMNPNLGCIGFDGQNYLQGQEELYYDACGTKQSSPCSDSLALVGLQYNSDDLSTLRCVQTSNANLQSQAVTCDISDNNQLLRIIRANPIDLSNNPSGPFARIFNRISGLCLTPLSATPFSGAKVGLTNCTINKGYVWWVFPPFSSDNGVLPQQLVYTTNINTPPSSKKELNTFLQDNKGSLFSLAFDTTGLVLFPMIVENMGDPNTNPRNTQLIDYQLYNLLLQYNTYDPGSIAYPAGMWGF